MAAQRRRLVAGLCLILVAGFWAAIASEAEEAPRAQINLSIVAKAESALTGAVVKDPQGTEIGRVQGLTRGSDGEIKTVQIARTGGSQGGGVIALDARPMVYLPKDNAIVTPVSRATTDKLPPISQK